MTSPLQQKLKIAGPVVVTANRLSDGAVIYRTANGGWSTDISASAVATTSERAKELLAAAAAEGVLAVEPYVAPVQFAADKHVLPGNLRERIRADGPTVAFPGP